VGKLPERIVYSPGRRALLGSAGLAMLGGLVTYTGLARFERDVRLIRPPGAAGDASVLELCTRCGQCMKVCPTNVIQPSWTKAGIEGVFTPEMDFRVGFCDWSCNECGKVCPTGAIAPLTLEAKRVAKIGRAYIDKNRCIPWADYNTCIVCQELCPVPDKAIALTQVEVTKPGGGTVKLARPEVVAERCIGCGVCENACPVVHESAITVSAIEPARPETAPALLIGDRVAHGDLGGAVRGQQRCGRRDRRHDDEPQSDGLPRESVRQRHADRGLQKHHEPPAHRE
jgi:formate hydrogenlyase subunit 6/NADH:ubiquinone oxidoreductase subunit I